MLYSTLKFRRSLCDVVFRRHSTILPDQVWPLPLEFVAADNDILISDLIWSDKGLLFLFLPYSLFVIRFDFLKMSCNGLSE